MFYNVRAILAAFGWHHVDHREKDSDFVWIHNALTQEQMNQQERLSKKTRVT